MSGEDFLNTGISTQVLGTVLFAPIAFRILDHLRIHNTMYIEHLLIWFTE